jgi:hypothetical protein
MIQWIRSTWCNNMHKKAMWPIHGKYICPRCLLEHAVEWEGPATSADYGDPTMRHAVESVPYAAEQRLC